MGGAQSQRVGSFDAASEGFTGLLALVHLLTSTLVFQYCHLPHAPMGVLKSQIDGVPIYCREGSYLALDVSQQYIMILVCMRK